MSSRKIAAALLGLSLALGIGGWMLLVAPQRARAASAEKQLAQTRDDLAQLNSVPTHQTQPVIKTSELYRLAEAMPAMDNEPDLMLGLSQFAKQWGVKLTGISPVTPSAAAGGYTTLPLLLTVSGNYGSVTRFLTRLRELVSVNKGRLHVAGPLFSVNSVTLAPDPKGKTETATISVNAFYYGTLAGATPLPSVTPTTTTSGG